MCDNIKLKMNQDIDLKKVIFGKIRTQWKTISKAYTDLSSKDQSISGISKPELKFYLNHWGLKITEQQFNDLYSSFDLDGDGKISYQDFNAVCGPEIHPGETLYFRQDVMKNK